MRFTIVLCVLAMVACAPAKPPVTKPPAAKVVPAKPAPAAAAAPVARGPLAAPALVQRQIGGIDFEGVAFDSRSHRLVVADQAKGPGSSFADAEAAGGSRHGLAAVNAGFFTPEGKPLGVLVAAGETRGSWNRASSLGSGVWFENAAGRMGIGRRENVSTAGMRELLQAGPMLVERGKAVGGLEAVKTSARIAVLWDGGSRWWIGRTSPCTLAQFAQAIATGNPAGWPVEQALNFDGGRSADLWISGSVPGGPLTRRPAWNRPVRNFLILVTR